METEILKRRIALVSDELFMRKLHKAAYHDVIIQQFGKWDDAFQASLFTKKWEPKNFEILELHGKPVGCVRIEDRPDYIFFAEIQFLPDFQGRGHGTSIIKYEIAKSIEQNKTLRLQVLQRNMRAKKLYERLGFKQCGQTDTQYVFEYTGQPDAAPNRAQESR